ncbi:MAG: MDR family MFS transporter, partial [Acidimicrobiales bacterium]
MSVVFVAAMFMNIMDATIVNVAIPTLGRDFHVAAASVGSVAIGYLVSLAVFIPASGWLGDRLGGKRVLLAATLLFTVASALCGVAGSFGELVAFRILQGVGGGMMAPVGMAMLFRTFPPAERIRASSILTVPTTLAPALGPVLGGLLVTDLSWRWVFYVNVPIGAAALLFGLLFLEDPRQSDPGHFDGVGFALAGVGLGLLMYGVSEGPSKGWGTPLILGTMLIGAALLAALVVWELRAAQPLIDMRLFADRLYRSATGVLILGSIAFIGVLYIVALFFQYGRGLSALGSGLSTFPEAFGVMLGAQLTSRGLYPRFGPRRVISGGLCGVAVSIGLMSLVGQTTRLWWMRLLLFAMGFAMAHVFVPCQAAAFATITPAATGRASTLFNAGRQVGSAVGVAVLSTVIAAVGVLRPVHGRLVANLTAYHWAFLAAAAVAIVGAGV